MYKKLIQTFLIFFLSLSLSTNLYSYNLKNKNPSNSFKTDHPISENTKLKIEKVIFYKIFKDYGIEETEVVYLKNNIAIAKGIIENKWLEYLYLIKLEKTSESKYNIKEVIELKTDLIIDSIKIIDSKNFKSVVTAGYTEVIEIVSHTHNGNGFLQLFNFNGEEIFVSDSKFYDAHYENSFYDYETIDKEIINKLKSLKYNTLSIINEKENNYKLNIEYNYNTIIIYGVREYTVFEDYDNNKSKTIATENIKEYYNFDKKNNKYLLQEIESSIKINK